MTNPLPGSRAIRIPLTSNKNKDNYLLTERKARTSRLPATNPLERGDSSDAGPSSISSDPDSSWSYSSPSTTGADTRQLRSIKNSVASPSDSNVFGTPSTPDRNASSLRKDKQKASESIATSPSSSSPNPFNSSSPLGPSMLHSSSYKSINLNAHRQRYNDYEDPDEPLRLITYTKHSQGFTWNDEMFLPGYLLGRRYYGEDRGHRGFDGDEEPCPVAEIFITDEEAAAMMP